MQALEKRIETFFNTLRYAKIVTQVIRPQEVIKHFAHLNNIVAEKRQMR
jgi:hypothetical protein